MISQLSSKWAVLTTLGLAVTGISGGSVTGYIHWDNLVSEVAANTSDRQYKRFQILEARAQSRPLTARERLEFCSLASALKIGGPVVDRIC